MDQERTPDSIGPLFDRHFDAVYSYVAYRMAPDIEIAQDLTQEVFLAALEGLPPGLDDDAASSWLRSVARNKTADHFRRLRESPALPADADELFQSPAGSARQEATLVSVAMRRLPGDVSDLLEDKYIEGLSVRRIAESRGSSEKAIESALSRARELFRRAFREVQSEQEACS